VKPDPVKTQTPVKLACFATNESRGDGAIVLRRFPEPRAQRLTAELAAEKALLDLHRARTPR
jgi:hypothetical protein